MLCVNLTQPSCPSLPLSLTAAKSSIVPVLCYSTAPYLSLVVLLLARARQAQRLVDVELAAEGIDGGADGGGQDDAERDQLRGDLLERAQALGDGVCYFPSLRQS